jgi:elongation factor P
MLTMNDLKPGVFFLWESEPWEVLEAHHLKMQQRRPVLQTKIRSLKTGKTLQHNFQQSDTFEEAEVEKNKITFLFSHRGESTFQDPKYPRARFMLPDEVMGEGKKFLKPGTELEAVHFQGKIITVKLPIKVDLMVKEAPPGTRGDTAQGGTKQVTLETGAVMNVPLFIEQGDTIRVNTETGEYAERISKSQSAR